MKIVNHGKYSSFSLVLKHTVAAALEHIAKNISTERNDSLQMKSSL